MDLETIRKRAVDKMYDFNYLGYFLFTAESQPKTMPPRKDDSKSDRENKK